MPTILLALFLTKKDLCPQSWKMMNILIKNPAATIESSKVIQYEYSRLLYIRYHINRYGKTELQICQILFFRSGWLYFITTLSQDLSDSCIISILLFIFSIIKIKNAQTIPSRLRTKIFPESIQCKRE